MKMNPPGGSKKVLSACTSLLPKCIIDRRLQCRQQTVDINNITSQTLTLDAGVPQGSVLGPLLAILYLNGLCDKITNKMFFMPMTALYTRLTLQLTTFTTHKRHYRKT